MLKAVMDRIIIRNEKEKSLLVFSGEQNVRNSGIVLDVGPFVKIVKPGDHVLFHRFDELPLPKDNMVVIREKSLLGIYRK